jgi:hypothetical protein
MKCASLTFLEVVSFPRCNALMIQKCTAVWKIFKLGYKHRPTLKFSLKFGGWLYVCD